MASNELRAGPMTGVARRIVGFRQDDEQHWVAELECGHSQHVRHKPPWQSRPWVVTVEGRAQALGETLICVQCVAGEKGVGPDD